MPLDTCIAHHTHRQMRGWIRWLDRQYDNPSRADYYLMQVAKFLARICAVLTGGEYSPDLEAYRLKPGSKNQPGPSSQDLVAKSKAAALAATGARKP